LDAVSLERCNEDLLKLDLEAFLNDKDFYQQLGLPYRRGILLYGRPGTGKTSLVNAIASELSRDLYMINLKEIDSDASLNAIFNSIPPNQIIVVEDCDTQSRGFGALGKGGGIDGSFSLATFLANLDGHCLAPGNIIILTTNHPEMLDPAIVRPGRMDLKIEMGYCSHYQIQKMY
ncbi:P-loop containing nucleoside triphosphate hydrolase protein, partial [Basidiobolus meristosporus CBS 931.73]